MSIQTIAVIVPEVLPTMNTTDTSVKKFFHTSQSKKVEGTFFPDNSFQHFKSVMMMNDQSKSKLRRAANQMKSDELHTQVQMHQQPLEQQQQTMQEQN